MLNDFTWDTVWDAIFGTSELWGLNIGFWVGMILCVIMVIVIIVVCFPVARHKKEVKVETTKKVSTKRKTRKSV